ncbi:hypothetical protein LCGC14_1023770 [marine sediment metagenome]|uniref:Sulfotransferase domain-containing protein n=1 Tax=marine sediment metagenome TaxID=412755 RepID=A0A0F9MWP8_9ZZZZ
MILVLGTGRSGTSTIARLLHTELGVSMGTRFKDPDSANAKGYYEDLDFLEINTDPTLCCAHREQLIFNLFDIRKEPWGLKEPRIPYFWRIYKKYINHDTKIIIATRAPHLVVASMRRHYGWTEQVSLKLIQERHTGIGLLTRGSDSIKIDFTDQRTDGELIKILTNYIR